MLRGEYFFFHSIFGNEIQADSIIRQLDTQLSSMVRVQLITKDAENNVKTEKGAQITSQRSSQSLLPAFPIV